MRGPLVASVWALIDGWKRPWSARALAQSRSGDALATGGDDQELRKAA